MDSGAATCVEVAEKYRFQLQSTVDAILSCGKTINEDVVRLTEEVKTQLQTVKEKAEWAKQLPEIIQDLTPIQNPKYTQLRLMQTYSWTAACLLGVGMGQLFGRYFLYHLFNAIFNTWVAILLAYLVIPLWFYFQDSTVRTSEDERRMKLFAISTALGILSGYILADLRVPFFSPPAFLFPFCISLVVGTVGPTLDKDRTLYLGSSIGFPVFVYLILALLTRSFRPHYLIWVVINAVIAALNLQIQLGKLQRRRYNIILAQFSTIITSVIIHTILMQLTYRSSRKQP